MNHGSVFFPGISKVISCSFTLCHGTVPSTGTLMTVPHTSYLPQVGNLVLSYGVQKVVLYDCLLTRPSLSMGGGSNQWTLTIQDRRWRWQYGIIDGNYNIPLSGDGTDVENEKEPSELASLCLDALGEVGYDVSAMPNDIRPQASWTQASPADELARLCNSLGCAVVLGLDNRIRILKVGTGAMLPTIKRRTLGISLDRAGVPSSIRVVTAPVRYQVSFVLEAVGMDTDGTWKPLDDLSYRGDEEGWNATLPDFYGISGNYTDDAFNSVRRRMLAVETVYKHYRVKELIQGGYNPAGYTGPPVDNILQLLPVYNVLNELKWNAEDEDDFAPGYIRGTWWAHSISEYNKELARVDDSAWSVDPKTGIVKFNDYFYRKSASGNTIMEAQLELVCTIEVTYKDLQAKEYRGYGMPVSIASAETPPEIIYRPDLVPRVTPVQVGKRIGSVNDNFETIDQECQRTANRRIGEYTTEYGGIVSYSGLMPLFLDGAINQINWSISSTGTFTTISRNSELTIPLLSPEERLKRRLQDTNDKKLAREVLYEQQRKKEGRHV